MKFSVSLYFNYKKNFFYLQPPTKSTKQATRGAKQIVEENVQTLQFYRNMIFGATVIYITVMSVFFEFTTLTTVSLTKL